MGRPGATGALLAVAPIRHSPNNKPPSHPACRIYKPAPYLGPHRGRGGPGAGTRGGRLGSLGARFCDEFQGVGR